MLCLPPRILRGRLALALTAPLFLAACTDNGVTKFNAEPTAEITSHSSGDIVLEGESVSLRGAVGDPDGATEDLVVSWLVADQAVCLDTVPDASGLVTCEHSFEEGGGEVILEVLDPGGAATTARVTLEVTPSDAPVADVTSPRDDTRFYADQLVTLEGTVSDAEDDATELAVSWESSLDGPLTGSFETPDLDGGLVGAVTLSEGDHLLTLTAVDTTGKVGRDSVAITVGPANSAPLCEVTAPADRTVSAVGEDVRFEARVTDDDISADQLAVSWESDLDGFLRDSAPTTAGDVVFTTADLTVGTHTISLTTTDEVGATCTDLTTITIGTPPSLAITSPGSGDTVNDGEPVRFTATVSDAEDDATEIVLDWTSDVDGGFSTQGADSSGQVDFSTTALSTGPQRITVGATDTDGLRTEQVLDLTVNAVPTAPTVTLSPDPAVTTDTLTATASGSIDPDGSGTVTYGYAWFVDGVSSSASTSATFPASTAARGSTVRVVVTPTDGIGSGETGEAERTIANADPLLTGPTLSSSTVEVGDTLTCSASATDPDGDTPVIAYAWQDGSTSATYTVPTSATPGDILTCTATAHDGYGGVASASTTAGVLNSAPVITVATLSPSTAYTDDTLSVSAVATDANGDTVSFTYDWYVDSVLVRSGTTSTLDGSSTTTGFDKGETVLVVVTASDGTTTTTATPSAVVIANSPPTAPVVAIDPADPEEGEDLYCDVVTASTDADGDAISYSMDWTVDSAAYTSTFTTTWTGDTVDGADPISGEVWACTATPTDGTDAGSTGSGAVTIQSSASSSGVFVLSERNASTTHLWEPSVSATGLSTYHSLRSNDTDCNAAEGSSDDFSVEHYGDGIYKGSTKIVSTPYAYPKHVAVFNGELVVMSRNDCTLKVYDFSGTLQSSIALGCSSGQGVATDGTSLFVSLWNGSVSSFEELDTGFATVATYANPSGLSGNNVFDFAYDAGLGEWMGLVTTGEGGTGTESSTVQSFTMGGAVTSSYSLSASMDGIGLGACP